MKIIKEITFIAKSAQEAAERVRNELGPSGRVISVRQHTGTGMGRFLSAPKLEVVARLEAPDSNPPAVSGAMVPKTTLQASQPEDHSEPFQQSSPAPTHAQPAPQLNCGEFLKRLGFKPALLARMESFPEWRTVTSLPVSQGLPGAVAWLRGQKAALALPNDWRRLGFVGGAGSGKTTALCKFLAREVLINNKKPLVLQTAVDRPHLDGSLEMYCEILGLPFSRYVSDLQLQNDSLLCVDFPGFSLHSTAELIKLNNVMDDLRIDTRVLVLNAACEEDTLGLLIDRARQLSVNAQVLTHIDEVVNFGKLWTYYLDRDRPLLFFANGPNVLGDTIEDPFGFLIEQTFPR